jgi:hypothetical protein
MPHDLLSDSSSGDEDDLQLTINEHFAKAYEYHKEREELVKCAYGQAFFRSFLKSLREL